MIVALSTLLGWFAGGTAPSTVGRTEAWVDLFHDSVQGAFLNPDA